MVTQKSPEANQSLVCGRPDIAEGFRGIADVAGQLNGRDDSEVRRARGSVMSELNARPATTKSDPGAASSRAFDSCDGSGAGRSALTIHLKPGAGRCRGNAVPYRGCSVGGGLGAGSGKFSDSGDSVCGSGQGTREAGSGIYGVEHQVSAIATGGGGLGSSVKDNRNRPRRTPCRTPRTVSRALRAIVNCGTRVLLPIPSPSILPHTLVRLSTA